MPSRAKFCAGRDTNKTWGIRPTANRQSDCVLLSATPPVGTRDRMLPILGSPRGHSMRLLRYLFPTVLILQSLFTQTSAPSGC